MVFLLILTRHTLVLEDPGLIETSCLDERLRLNKETRIQNSVCFREMADFWSQFAQYSTALGVESSETGNADDLLPKLLAHAENERQALEVQVRTQSIVHQLTVLFSVSSVQSCFHKQNASREFFDCISIAEWDHHN